MIDSYFKLKCFKASMIELMCAKSFSLPSLSTANNNCPGSDRCEAVGGREK
ncbi:MAG: hypothetical protein QW303_07875 [Nitrososphaerota archaeon]